MPSRKIAAEPNLSTMPFEYQWHCVAHTVPTLAVGKRHDRKSSRHFLLRSWSTRALGTRSFRAPSTEEAARRMAGSA